MNGPAVGIDRLSISFPVRSYEDDLSGWGTATVRSPSTPHSALSLGTQVAVADGVKAFVGVSEVPDSDQRWWGKVEFNPSRVIDPEGVTLCPVDQLPAAIEVVLGAVEALVEPSCSVAEMRTKRLDAARDFEGVTRPGSLLSSLATVHRPWSRKNNLFNDGSRNGAQTLSVGGRSSGVNLYDKFVETKGGAPEGTLRWEARARSGWLAEIAGIKSLSDINTQSVEHLASNRWEWSAMGTEVTATDEVVERVMRSGLSPSVQQSLLGWMLMTAKGKQPSMGFQKAAKYRRIARQLGVTLAADLFDDGNAFVARLDWESGTEVCRAA